MDNKRYWQHWAQKKEKKTSTAQHRKLKKSVARTPPKIWVEPKCSRWIDSSCLLQDTHYVIHIVKLLCIHLIILLDIYTICVKMLRHDILEILLKLPLNTNHSILKCHSSLKFILWKIHFSENIYYIKSNIEDPMKKCKRITEI